MHEFDRACARPRVRVSAAGETTRHHHQRRPQPLATRQDHVRHGFTQSGRHVTGRRERLLEMPLGLRSDGLELLAHRHRLECRRRSVDGHDIRKDGDAILTLEGNDADPVIATCLVGHIEIVTADTAQKDLLRVGGLRVDRGDVQRSLAL